MQEAWICGFIPCCRLRYFPFFFFFCLATFKTQRGACTSGILFFPLDLHFATTQACFCKDVQDVFCKNVWRVYVLRGVRTWKSYAKSDLTVQTETDFQKCDLNTNVAQNGFAQIGFHVVRCHSDYLNMIGFQSDLHKNRIWADSLNEATVVRHEEKNKRSVVGLFCNKSHTIHFWTFYRPLLETKLLVNMSRSQ